MSTTNKGCHKDDRKAVGSDGLSYEEWCKRFFADAQAQGLLHNAEHINDVALELFWRDGVAPSIRALLDSTAELVEDEATASSPQPRR